jgi:hypothetical protein
VTTIRELYDPATMRFSSTGTMAEETYQHGIEWHATTSLRDGSVLITGGNDDNTCGGFSNAEIYDPSSRTFHAVGPMTISRDIHTSTLLPDGTVLIAGGGDGWCGSSTHATAEIYDPVARTFTATASMAQRRSAHTATLLNDGSVLITGVLAVRSPA